MRGHTHLSTGDTCTKNKEPGLAESKYRGMHVKSFNLRRDANRAALGWIYIYILDWLPRC